MEFSLLVLLASLLLLVSVFSVVSLVSEVFSELFSELVEFDKSSGAAITGVDENNTREPKSKPSSARNNFGSLVCRFIISIITP